MGWKCLHSILKDASANENYEKTYLEVYELDSIDDFNRFLFSCKKKNTLVAEDNGSGGYVYFIVDSNNITKRQPMPGGKVQLELTIRLRYFRNFDTLLAPWDLGATNFRISQSANEESVSKFYPGGYPDVWLDEDTEPYPFVNSAGVMLEGTSTYSIAQISFSYAIGMDKFDMIQNSFWNRVGVINAYTEDICGMKFRPRTLKIEALNAEYCETQKPGLVTTGIRQRGVNVIVSTEVKDVLYKYYRVDVTLAVNPRSWNQEFLNVGTHVRRNGVLSRLWSWYDTQISSPMWGTYTEYRNSGCSNGEALTEPVALNGDGSNASPYINMQTGGLVMTYRYGALFEPVSFAEFGFPKGRPVKWDFGG